MINKVLFCILALFVLFFPTKYYVEFHIIYLFIVFLLLFVNRFKLNYSLYSNYFSILIVLICTSSLLSSIYLSSDFLRNFTEVFRFIPSLLLLLMFKGLAVNIKFVNFILSIYTIIVSLFCFLQYIGYSPVIAFSSIYGSDLQVEHSLLASNRALGLSTGPGNNGALFSILYTYYLISIICLTEKKIFNVLLLVLCILSILFSQSQTALVVIAMTTIFSIFMMFLKNRKKMFNFYNFSIIGMILLLTPYFLFKNLDKLGYLISLFDQGLSRNSYQVRMYKNDLVYDLVFSNPFFFFLGYGKDLVPNATALDNEIIFYLGVYGAISVLLLIVFYLSFFIVFLKNKFSYWNFLLCAIVFAGSILSWPSGFTLDPRILFIFTLFLIISLKKNTQ